MLLSFQAVGFACDVRKQEDARRVVEATVDHFGKLDILVNAAAGNFLVSAEDLSPNGFKTGLPSALLLICCLYIEAYDIPSFLC